MKSTTLLPFLLIFFVSNIIFSQEIDRREALSLGQEMTEENSEDLSFFGNWIVIVALSDAAEIDLMPHQEGPVGQYLFLKPTHERSAVSSYIEEEYHSVDLGFYTYREKNNFFGNLDASVAVMFEEEFKGQLIAFKCEYIEDKDQLKLTTAKNVVFYLERME